MRNLTALLILVAGCIAGCGGPHDCLQPHLLAFAGTPEEIDLGPFVDWDHAWSEDLGAYYRATAETRSLVVFAAPDCIGASAAVAVDGKSSDRYAIGSTGTILEIETPTRFAAMSASTDGQCVKWVETLPANSFTDTGISAGMFSRGSLSVDLR